MFHEAGARVIVSLLGHDEDGFDIWLEVAIHEGHLKFVFEIGYGSEPANDGGGLLLFGEIDEEAAEGGYRCVWRLPKVCLQERNAFLRVEEGLFAGIVGDADDDFVEHAAGALKHVEMSVRDGVEGAWVDANPHKPIKTRNLRRGERLCNAGIGVGGEPSRGKHFSVDLQVAGGGALAGKMRKSGNAGVSGRSALLSRSKLLECGR